MTQRSRIGPPSDLRSLRQQGRAGWSCPSRAALKNVAAAVLLAGAFFALPKVVGPNFLHDLLSGGLAAAIAAGDWMRAALAYAFDSIPVR